MKIYIDKEYKCHAQNDGTLTEVETAFFDGKCAEFIDGYVFVPSGSVWIRENGEECPGELAVPWKDPNKLDKAQREYEKQLLAEYAEALKTVGVTL